MATLAEVSHSASGKLRCFRCGPLTDSDHDSDSDSSPQLATCPSCGEHLANAPIHRAALENVAQRQSDQSFVAPYTYKRSLLTVPGKVIAVPMTFGHNDAVAQALRSTFIPRDSDIWIATYPKSGTTWVQEMLSLLLYGEGNAAQGQLGVGLSTEEHVLWLEALCAIQASQPTSDTAASDSTAICSTSNAVVSTVSAIEPLLATVNGNAQRRCFKSHSPLGLLQGMLTTKSKVIHVARNPKDVAVSMWHHTCSKNFGYDGPWSHFLEKMFLPGEVESGPWWDFVLPYVQKEEGSGGGSGARDGISLDSVVRRPNG